MTETIRPAQGGSPYVNVLVYGRPTSGRTVGFDYEGHHEPCRVYWGSHGCSLPRGHDKIGLPHVCLDCFEPEDMEGYVGAPPYYGRGWHFDRYLTPRTYFYGEDAPFTHRLRSCLRNWRVWARNEHSGS